MGEALGRRWRGAGLFKSAFSRRGRGGEKEKKKERREGLLMI